MSPARLDTAKVDPSRMLIVSPDTTEPLLEVRRTQRLRRFRVQPRRITCNGSPAPPASTPCSGPGRSTPPAYNGEGPRDLSRQRRKHGEGFARNRPARAAT